jgi:hypothetical protein
VHNKKVLDGWDVTGPKFNGRQSALVSGTRANEFKVSAEEKTKFHKRKLFT